MSLRLRAILLTAALLLGLLAPAPARAQGSPPGPGSPGARQALEHRLIAGDEVEVHILALPKEQRVFTLRSDGGFYHPIAGEIEAAGLTIQDLQAQVRQRLSGELRNPEVRVGLHTMARQDVTVLGEVAKPGKYEVVPGTNLLDVLAMAGGNTTLADLSSAVLMREGKQETVDLTPPDPKAQEVNPFPVQPGDILYLLPGTSVSITGDVFNPGVYALPRSEANPMRALRAAGGARPGAALNRVILQRASLEHPMMLDLSVPEADLPEVARTLRAGDMLSVPPRQVVLLGGVSKAGPQPLQGGENVLEVIMNAGITDPKKLGDVTIIRGTDIRAGRQKTEKVDLTPYIEKGDTSVLVPVYDGDVVYVPAPDQGGFNIWNLLQSTFWIRGLFGIL